MGFACLLENFKPCVFYTKGHCNPCITTDSASTSFKSILDLLICQYIHLLPVSEAWSHAYESRACRVLLYWPSQPKESMVFHSTLPEVLTGLGVVHPEDKGVLLFFALGRIGVRLDFGDTEKRICSQYSNIQHGTCNHSTVFVPHFSHQLYKIKFNT